jgi:hypothetical protein
VTSLYLAAFLLQSVTWREAAPVLDRWCNDCHRTGQVGPFDFTQYDAASAYAPEIARYIMAGKMPPWRAKPSSLAFANSRRIDERSVATLLAWINGGAVRGSGEAAVRPRHPQWHLGPPDLVISQPREHTVSGEKTVEIVSFPVNASELGTDKAARYLQAFELRPSNRNLLHHAVLRSEGRALAAWAMTDTGMRLPPGVAWRLARNASLTVELHYFKRNVRPARDLTRVALYFAKAAPAREAELLKIVKPDLRIPAGANLHRESLRFRVPEAVHVHSFLPVFQLLASAIKLRAAGAADWALWVEPFEHHLMSSYVLSRPWPLARSMELEIEATYDNSAQNEFNPHKTLREVVFAENGLDETFRVWLTVSKPTVSKSRALR